MVPKKERALFVEARPITLVGRLLLKRHLLHHHEGMAPEISLKGLY
jgi:hypothetical protein